jgi:hypothetical protein
VGKQVANTPPAFENFTAGMPSHFTAAESGHVVAWQTQAYPTWPTMVAGVLKQDRRGSYTPTLQAAISTQGEFIQPLEVSLTNASLLNPVPWPVPSSAAQRGAYTYISRKLYCNDIRAAYTNANSTPGSWETQLTVLVPPKFLDQTYGPFTEADFNAVKTQLLTEFIYLQNVQNQYTNISSLENRKEANVPSILTEAGDAVNADISNDTTSVTSKGGAWFVIADDVLPNLGNVSDIFPVYGPQIRATIGVATTALNDTVARTNDSSGASLVQQALANEDILMKDLIQTQTSQFDNTITTLGNDFARIVSD